MKNKRVIAIILLLGILPSTITYSETQKKDNDPKIKSSLETSGLHISKALEEFANKVGYSIKLQSNVDIDNERCSVQVINMSFVDGLNKILKEYNYMLEINDQKRSVLIRIASLKEGSQKGSHLSSRDELLRANGNKIVNNDYEGIPPNYSGLQEYQPEIDPLDLELAPPNNPGEKGMTRRELNAILKNREKIDPLDLELAPPSNPGEKGMTQRELNAILKNREKIDPLDLEVVPPDKSGQKGITRRELDAILDNRNK